MSDDPIKDKLLLALKNAGPKGLTKEQFTELEWKFMEEEILELRERNRTLSRIVVKYMREEIIAEDSLK